MPQTLGLPIIYTVLKTRSTLVLQAKVWSWEIYDLSDSSVFLPGLAVTLVFKAGGISHTSFHGPSNRIQVNTFGYTWIHLNTVRPWKTLEFCWSRNQLNTIGHLDTTEYIRIHLDTFRHLDRFEDV